MELTLLGSLMFADMASAFPVQLQPPYDGVDYAVNLTPNATSDYQNLKSEDLLNVLVTTPLFVPHNQVNTSGTTIVDDGTYIRAGLPAVNWSTITIGGASAIQAFAKRPWSYQHFDVLCTNEAASSSMSCYAATDSSFQWPGLTLLASKNHFQYANTAAAGTTTTGGLTASGSTTLALASAVGFPAAGTVYVPTQTALVSYGAISGNILVGIPSSGTGSITASIPNGTDVQPAAATTGGSTSIGATSLTLVSALGFPTSGSVTVSTQSTPIFYTGISSNTLTGISASGVGNITSAIPNATTVIPAGVASTWELRFQINSYLFSILGGISASPLIRRCPNDGNFTWKTLNGKVKSGQNTLKHLGNATPQEVNDHIEIQCLTLNGQLLISLGGDSNPFCIALANESGNTNPFDQAVGYPFIQNVQVYAQNFTQWSWHVHPIKFAKTGYYISLEQQYGFTPDSSTPVYGRLTTCLTAATVTAGNTVTENNGTVKYEVNQDGQSGQYKITLTNPTSTQGSGTYNGQKYSDQSIGLVRVTSRIDPMEQSYPYVGTSIVPKEIHEVISFDPNSLSIHHAFYTTLDNFYGINSLLANTGIRGFGNVGVSMRLGWQHMGASSIDGLPALQHFYGYCDTYNYTRGPGGQALIRMSCVDQMEWLARSLIAAPPDFDLCNHYYVVAWYAQKAGITRAQMAFSALIPDDPYGVAPGDTNPYFLPAGDGMHPWSPRDRTISALDGIGFIRGVTGFLHYFDAYGYMRYEPFISPSLQPVVKVFRETADYGYGLPGGAVNEIRSLDMTISTKETRNQLVLIGIDSWGADWNPIVQKREDSNSIYCPPGYTPAANFCGFPKPLVWMDSRFANAPFASAAADAIFAIASLPDFECNLSAWPQPEIFPMQNIYVDDPKSNSYGIPFFVTNVVNHWSILGDQYEMTSQVSGKLLGG